MVNPEEMPSNEALENQDFDTIVKSALERLPEPEQSKDPYAQSHPLIRTISHTGRKYRKDGQIEFDQEDDEVRRQWLGDDIELMFVHNTHRDDTEFIIHEFAEKGGLDARTKFFPTSEGYKKARLSGEYIMEGLLGGENGRTFNRYLDDEESEVLRHIMVGAIEGADVKPAIEEFLTVTDEEQAMIDANAAEVAERRRKYEKDMEKLREARRRGAERASQIFLR